jgi:hypothetical protein
MPDDREQDPIQAFVNDLDGYLSAVALELGTSLGLIRVLTLLPLFDPALSEVESRLARSWDALRKARRLIADQSAADTTDFPSTAASSWPDNVRPLHRRAPESPDDGTSA